VKLLSLLHEKLSAFTQSGPLSRRVFRAIIHSGKSKRLVVVVHAFYTEELNRIVHRLEMLPIEYDLIITTPVREVFEFSISLKPVRTQRLVVFQIDNVGRDIGPFLRLIRSRILYKYSVGLKLHTKKSTYSPLGEKWAETLLTGLLRSESQIQKTVEAIENGDVGISGDKTQFLSDGRKYWGENRSQVEKIRQVLGIDKVLHYDLGFFAGSMFWFNPKALKTLRKIGFGIFGRFAFDVEAGQRDGTLAHSIERVFADICVSSGYLVSDVNSPSKPLDRSATISNSIIVE
jgi:lipopolysaccharide biosynthesis protein